jgi:hypothetical protein
MGLVNLKTDLKSLRYGNDRPGGGSSGQPYITTPIPNGLTANGPDFLLRQGALEASLTDSERLFKFFFDPLSPKGLLFATKQIALERQNPAVPGGLNRIYLPTSTISQAGSNAVGGHLNRQGLDPFTPGYFTLGAESDGYFKFTLNKDTQDNTGRLSELFNVKIAGGGAIAALGFNAREFNISTDSEFSISYSGGPNSILGLGRTNIKLAGDGSGSPRDRTNTYKPSSDLTQNLNQVYTFDNGLLANQTPFIEKKSTSLIGITDYRKQINNSIGVVLPETDYKSFNREDKYGTSKTVYSVPPLSRYNPNDSLFLDELNSTYPQTSADVPENLVNLDLIKFFFEVIDPEDSTTNVGSEFLFFRAYLNSIGDNFKGDWQPYRYVGRAENFYRYTGFSRDVSLSFIIYAHSRAEMLPLYQKLNKLIGTTTPRYAGNGYMLGNFVKLTVGTYFNSVPGIINNINLKPSFEAGWDINRYNEDGEPIPTTDKDYYVGQIPRMIEVDITFTPIHDFAPQYPTKYVEGTNTLLGSFINNEPVSKPPNTETPAVSSDPVGQQATTDQQPFELSLNNFRNLDTSPSQAPIVTGDLFPGAIEVGP